MSPTTLYNRLLNVAYGYYILIGLFWLSMSGFFGHYFNVYALLITALLAMQAYYRVKLVNLLLGIVLIFLSIYSLLDFLAMGGKSGFNGFVNVMSALSFISIIMAGVLVFGYLKLSLAEKS